MVFLTIALGSAMFFNLAIAQGCQIFSTSQRISGQQSSSAVSFIWIADGTFDFDAFSRFALKEAYAYLDRIRLKHPLLEDVVVGNIHLFIARLKAGELQNVNEGADLKPYFYRTLQNSYRKFWRVNRNTISLDNAMADSGFEPDAPKPYDLNRVLEIRALIGLGIREIASSSKTPDRNRQILELYYFQDKGQKEISQMLDMNESTVKIVIHRAKDKLRSYLSENGLDPDHYIEE